MELAYDVYQTIDIVSAHVCAERTNTAAMVRVSDCLIGTCQDIRQAEVDLAQAGRQARPGPEGATPWSQQPTESTESIIQ